MSKSLEPRPDDVIHVYRSLSASIGGLDKLRTSPMYSYQEFAARIAPIVEELRRERDVIWNQVNR